MFAANEDVKSMAKNGELKALHEECNTLGDKCEADYLSQRDKIENLIQSIRTKENNIYEALRNDHGLDHLKLHETSGGSIFDVLAYASSGATIENMNHLSSALQDGANV
jgi:hypothetical protein